MRSLSHDTSLLEVLKQIECSEYKTVYVTKNEKLIGAITDGDIRRAIVKYKTVDIPIDLIMNPNPTYRDFRGNLINSKKDDIDIRSVPLVSSDGKIVDESAVEGKYLPIAEPLLDKNEFSLLDQAYKSTWISSTGAYIEKFEEEFAKLNKKEFAVSCSNGTAALFMALSALGVSGGDEVIIPNLTFGAVANSVILAGGNPVFVDTEATRPIMDVEQICRSINSKTKAIIVVHSYGFVVDVKKLKDRIPVNIKIIEDCAEAHFASLHGNLVGTYSDISCFSFFANKILTTGEGGMCLTSNSELAQKMRIFRDHGMSRNKKYWHEVVGFNLRLTNLQAAIGVAQINRIDEILNEREHSCQIWKNFLNNIGLKDVFIPTLETEIRGLWLFNIKLELSVKRSLKEKLREAQLETRDFFFCLNDMPPFAKYVCDTDINSKDWEKTGLSLPVYSDALNNKILKKRLDDVCNC